ncbi:hypothetical protein LINPERHAP2_LOCUS29201 [Linum perenne]
MIIRRDDGSVMQFRTSTGRGCPEAKECEAKALLDALLWLRELGIRNIKIEMDSQVVCQAMNSMEDDVTEYGDIIRRCKSLVGQNMKICFIRKDRNVAAHVLARQSRNSVSPTTGETPPSWLDAALRCICRVNTH